MDKRKNNGNKGHSTKSNGIDKRKNIYRDVKANAVTPEKLVKVISMLVDKAIEDKDVAAAKIILDYYIIKPVETIENINYNIEHKEITEEEAIIINKALESEY